MADSMYYCVKVSADGKFSDAYDLSSDLASVVWEERNCDPAMLTVVVPDPYKVMGHALREGMWLQYELGTENDHTVVFCGIIYTVEASFPPAGIPKLTLKAYDGLKELGMHRYSAPRQDEASIFDVVQAVVGDPSYKFATTMVDISTAFMVQEALMAQTDLAYLATLCQEHDCFMFVRANTGTSGDFTFTDAATLMKQPPDVTLSYGRTGTANPMIEFEATVDADSLHVPDAVSSFEWLTGAPIAPIKRTPDSPLLADDPYLDENLAAIDDSEKRGKLAGLIAAAAAAEATIQGLRLKGGEAEASEPLGPFSSVSAMQHKAENWCSIHAFGMTGSGRTGGTPKLRASAPVQIDDVGGRFSGKWFVTEVRHTLGREGYHTEFSCKR